MTTQQPTRQMTAAEIESEERAARRAGVLAFASGFVMLGSMAFLLSANPKEILDDRERLAHYDEYATALIVERGLFALSLLLMIPVLVFIYRAIRARSALIPPITRGLAIVGPAIIGIVGLLHQIARIARAQDFSDDRVRTLEAAREKVDTDLIRAFEFTLFPGGLMMGFALLILSLHAMRAGLMTKGQGFAGIAIAVLMAASGGLLAWLPIMFALWLGWVGMTIMAAGERRMPAWREGRAVPWPNAAELRRQAETDDETADKARDVDATSAVEHDASKDSKPVNESGKAGDGELDPKA